MHVKHCQTHINARLNTLCQRSNAQGAPEGAAQEADAGSASADDVVDAEFEEVKDEK